MLQAARRAFRAVPAALAGVSLVVLGACASGAPGQVPSHPLGSIEPSRPILTAPGQAEIAVSGRREGATIEQRIVYPNRTAFAGENYQEIRLKLAGSRPWDMLLADGEAKRFRVRLADIEQRIEREFPGVEMRIAPAVRQGPRGPYAYAATPAGAPVGCILAWEVVEEPAGFIADVAVLRRVFGLCEPDESPAILLDRFEAFRPAAALAGMGPRR